MEATLHKLLEDIFTEQEMAAILNLALLQVSDPAKAELFMNHMSSFNGGWAKSANLKYVKELRTNMHAVLTLARQSDSFSFVPLSSPDMEMSDGGFHNAIVLRSRETHEPR